MRNIPVKTIYSLPNKPRKVNRLFQGVESSLYQFSVVKSTECKYFGNVKPISRTIRNLSLSFSRKISTFRRETGMLLTEEKKGSWKPNCLSRKMANGLFLCRMKNLVVPTHVRVFLYQDFLGEFSLQKLDFDIVIPCVRRYLIYLNEITMRRFVRT